MYVWPASSLQNAQNGKPYRYVTERYETVYITTGNGENGSERFWTTSVKGVFERASVKGVLERGLHSHFGCRSQCNGLRIGAALLPAQRLVLLDGRGQFRLSLRLGPERNTGTRPV